MHISHNMDTKQVATTDANNLLSRYLVRPVVIGICKEITTNIRPVYSREEVSQLYHTAQHQAEGGICRNFVSMRQTGHEVS